MDVDNDGDSDLLLFFNSQDMNLTSGSINATLTGQAYDGIYIRGTDSVEIVTRGKK